MIPPCRPPAPPPADGRVLGLLRADGVRREARGGAAVGERDRVVRFAFMLLPVLAVPRLARKAVEFQRLDLLVYRGIFGGRPCCSTSSPSPTCRWASRRCSTTPRRCSASSSPRSSSASARTAGCPVPLAAALVGLVLAAGGGGAAGALLRFGRWEMAGLASAVLSGRGGHRHPRRPPHRGLAGRSTAAFPSAACSPRRPSRLPGFRRPTLREWLSARRRGRAAPSWPSSS